MKGIFFYSTAMASAAVVGCLVAGSAVAQDGGASGDSALGAGDIIVTAQRRDERLSRVGITVAAVGAEQLDKLHVESTSDLARIIPGFQAGLPALGGAPNYYLRGVGFNTQNANSTAPVGIYVDEVAYAYPYMSLGADFDLERVEVLKGPQGTFYGRNTTGGLIGYVSAKPTKTFDASLTAGIGNFGRYEFSGHISGPISDTLRGRLAFDSMNHGTWQRSITRKDELGESHRNAVRGILEWEPSDRFSLTTSALYWKKTGDTQAPQAIQAVVATTDPEVLASLQPNVNDNRAADWAADSNQPQSNITGIIRPPLRVNSDFYGLMARASYSLTDGISLVSLTAYNRLKHHEVVDSEGVQHEHVTQGNDGIIKSFSQELRLVGQSDQLNWSVGGYYANDKTNETTLGYAGQLPTILFLRSIAQSIPQTTYTPTQIDTSYRLYAAFARTTDRLYAAFGNVEYKLNDQLKLAIGARYTTEKINFVGSGVDTGGNNVPVVNILFPIFTGNPVSIAPGGSYTLNAALNGFVTPRQKQDQDNFAWRANLTYTPTDNLLFYSSISRGYKSGSFPVFSASNETQLEPVSQEKLTAYELGVKYSTRQVQFNASGFYYDYANRQVYGQVKDLIFGTLPRIINVPKSRVWGLEGDMTFMPDPSVTLRLSLAYLNAKISRYTGYNQFGNIQNFKGSTFPFAPKFQSSVYLGKDFDIGGDKGIEVGFDGSYQSASNTYIGDLPLFRIKGYPLAGASVALHDNDDKWRLTAWVRNLFNQYYWGSAILGHDTAGRLAGMPRTFGVKGTYNF